jgi:hypothetical protein
MRVALDTNIFHNDRSLAGGSFEALARLAEANHVEVLIPEVIAREFTALSSEQLDAVTSYREAIKKLHNTFPNSLRSRINALKKSLNDLTESFESEATSTFNLWLERVSGRVIKPGSEHAQRILLKYFDGTLPFGDRKARKDFPDAFIVETILDLAVDEKLFFVTSDSRMQRTFANAPNITVFNSLDDLLKANEFVAGQKEVDLAINTPRIIQVINESKEIFDNALLEGLSNIAKDAHYKGRDEEEDLYIDVLEEIYEWSLGTDDAEYIGEGVISVSFEATIDGSIDEPSEYGMDWYPYSSRPVVEARVDVGGLCSFIIDPLDLADPATCLEVGGGLGRVRLEVDEIHYINVSSIGYEE